MQLYIPTFGRAERQETYKRLVQAGLQERVKLVVDHREQSLYPDLPIIVAPAECNTISKVRQFIVDKSNVRYICMIDDDLSFFRRRDDEPTKLRDISNIELIQMFREIEIQLCRFPHVGVAAREGANRNDNKYMDNTRILRLLAYDVSVLNEQGITFDAVTVMEDFHVALQLLERGFPNRIINWYAHNNDKGSNSPGGCSSYRTEELQSKGAQLLRELHPRFVSLVQKKGWQGMGTRLDVRIQWKEAFGYGQRTNPGNSASE